MLDFAFVAGPAKEWTPVCSVIEMVIFQMTRPPAIIDQSN